MFAVAEGVEGDRTVVHEQEVSDFARSAPSATMSQSSFGQSRHGALSKLQVSVVWQLYQPFPRRTTAAFLPGFRRRLTSYSIYESW